ncbi:MAG: hypothetical protein J6A55_00545 [Oscillospiraceae bacterium]|nr:hypothetical protein [Oscillospiraceae bacterium]
MYNEIRLEKSLYSIGGKTFTQALTALDPDENYQGTELSSLDAFERQLKRFDIKVSGENCDRVEKFFTTAETAVLFPEYVRRAIKQGMDNASILPCITAAVGYTDGIDFRGLTITSDDMTTTAQGEALPETTCALASSATEVKKFGRKLSCTYESIRKQRIEALTVVLKNVGASIARHINLEAVNVLSQGAKTSSIAGATVAYSDLAAFWASLPQYDMTTIVTSPAVMADILALDEMKYCVNDFMASGRVVTPYGVTIVKCSNLDGDKLIGLDNTCALESVFATDVIVDFDKLMSTQCEEIACSVMVGFSKVASDAVAVMNA